MVLCSANVFAASAINQVEVNCDNVELSTNTFSRSLSVIAKWEDKAEFPNPPKKIMVGDTYPSKSKTFSYKCPEYSVSYDGNVLEIVAGAYDRVLEVLSGSDQKLRLKGSSYSFDIKYLELMDISGAIPQGESLAENFRYFNIGKDAVIGYKADGGDMKPMLYDQKVGKYANDLTRAKNIDIYHKNRADRNSLPEAIQRIFIDKDNGILRIYKKYNFPER